MTRKTASEVDEGTKQGGKKRVALETAADKAREALKHNHPEKVCDVTVRAHNRDHDSSRNVTDHLIRTGEEWIAVRTWVEAGSGSDLAVTDHGETLQLEAPGLDHNLIADRICSEAFDAIDTHEAVGRPVKPFTTLVRNVADVTDNLVTRWQTASEHVVRERLCEGIAGWTGRTAWTAHEEEAIYIEADRAATWFINEYVTGDVSDDVKATLHDIYVQALYDSIAEHRSRRTPHLEYAAEVVLVD
ncbi:hypothetical protein D8Y22_02180 [Salinadaptatus halalkaliphilus]|uniref:Uncharacterized protein n=1 Tax=Salinadaptatus halalkaliphilus TaxID=2419781 RepID=A0A4S3TQ17_9EURY|nr:hypothetical protein [Salinadaptatus halalkaliphilus]THE66484.1 hypothetical protein D8Y22_02180 [Salinadaptatus halalkaliphilus]